MTQLPFSLTPNGIIHIIVKIRRYAGNTFVIRGDGTFNIFGGPGALAT
jgi:hypothetical protein